MLGCWGSYTCMMLSLLSLPIIYLIGLKTFCLIFQVCGGGIDVYPNGLIRDTNIHR